MKHIKPILIILIGSCFFAIGINSFAIANQLAEGGFTGIAIIIHYLWGYSTGIVLFLLNIPVLIIGYKVLGKQTLIYTIIGLAASTILLEITKGWHHPLNDLLLAALYTGVFVGFGLGLIFRAGGTTGGVDIIARLCQKYLGLSIGAVMLSVDFLIILSSSFLIGLDIAMYTLVAVFIGSRMIDFVVEGWSRSKAVTIISNSAAPIAKEMNLQLKRGVTIYEGHGAFTGNKKQVLYIVLAPRQVPKCKQIVLEVDANAFVVVHDAREVLGEGFTSP